MFELYDITATYSDGKGRVHTSPVTSFPWKVEYSYMPLRVHAQLEINFQPKPHIVRKESYTVGCNAYINWDCLQGGGENYSETDCYKISAEEVDAFLNDMDRKIAEGKYKLKKSFNYK